MAVRAFDTAALNAASVLDAPDVRPARVEELDDEAQLSASEIPTSSGCLRGFCWAMGIEAATALCVYGAWRLWTFLR